MSKFSRRAFTGSGLALLGAWATGVGRAARAASPADGQRPLLGTIKPRGARQVAASPLGVGFETLDRRMFDPARTYDHLAALGVKWARIQSGWARCETEPGRYDFAWLDEVIERLLAIDVQPWFNLGYGNRLYTPEAPDPSAVGWAPMNSDAAKQAWTRFIAALVERYRDRVRHWEIWNESNIDAFWKPTEATGANYTALVKLTAPVIRAKAPEAIIVGGALNRMPTDFLADCFAQGMADYVDRVSYHPYSLFPEAGCDGAGQFAVRPIPGGHGEYEMPPAPRYVDTVAQWRAMLAKQKPALALWQGECGCPSSYDGVGALAQFHWNESRQARWLLRRIVLDRALDLELISFYHLVDQVNYNWAGRVERPQAGIKARTNFRGDFGLLRGDDYTPKPSYYAYQNLCALFDSATATAKIPLAFAGLGAVNGAGPDAAKDQPAAASGAKEITHAGFVRGGHPLCAYWWPTDVQMDRTSPPVDVTIRLARTGAALRHPVLVDPLDGKVYRLDGASSPEGTWEFAALPLADYPMLITDAAVAQGDG